MRTSLVTCLIAMIFASCIPLTAEAYQNPALGRFMQRDPAGYVDGMGLTEYTASSPIAERDPYGLTKGLAAITKRAMAKQEARDKLIARLLEGGDPAGECLLPCCEKISVIIEFPDPCAAGFEGKGLGGHTGIGIGDEYYDFGPAQGVKAIETVGGCQWWDYPGRVLETDLNGDPIGSPSQIGLAAILSNVGRIAHGHDVFKVELCAKREQTDLVRKYWKNLYNAMPNYCVAGLQCTSSTQQSLASGGLFSTFLRGISPLDFLPDLRRLNHTCGPSVGKRVKVERINSR